MDLPTYEVCNNCKKEIPEVNFVMHVAHCARNVEVCSDCGEPVHTSLKDEHRKQYHETMKCDLCGQDVIRSQLETHKADSCSESLLECTTCGLELPFRKLNDHEVYCRSRTELCERCEKYVMIKDLPNHRCIDQVVIEEEVVTIPCEFCGEQLQMFQVDAHQSRCRATDDDNDDVQIIDEPSLEPIREYSRENSYEGAETTNGIIDNVDNSIHALPCEFCNELYPSDKLIAHQSECLEGNKSTDDDDYTNRRDDDADDRYSNNGQIRPDRFHTFHGIQADPLNMIRLHHLLFGSVLNSMTTRPNRHHHEDLDNDFEWPRY